MILLFFHFLQQHTLKLGQEIFFTVDKSCADFTDIKQIKNYF